MSDHDGVGEFVFDENNDQTLSLNNKRDESYKRISIKINKLDSIAKEFQITTVDLIKIDVEGFEAQVLKGMMELLHNSPDIVMILEVLENKNGADIEEALKDYNFKYFYIDEKTGLKPSENIIRHSGSRNYLICNPEMAKKVMSIVN